MNCQRKKRVLIFTVTAGNAHNSYAKAVAEQLTARGAEVKIIDYFCAWHTPRQRWMADDGYNLVCTYAPGLYNAIYRKEQRRLPCRRFDRRMLAQKLSLCVAKELLRVIDDFRPDAIFCSHFYAAIAISDIRLVMNIPAKVYLTMTDYHFNPYWEAATGVDYLNLSSPERRLDALRLGYKDEQLICTGLPVSAKFLKQYEKEQARALIGADAKAFTLMIMFGGGQWSGGYKIFRQTIKAISGVKSPVQIIMINGRNERDRKRIERLLTDGRYMGHPVINVGFTENIENYMAAADVIVTKLGGASSTECINMGLPIVAAEKLLPQQEKDNASYLRNRGAVLTYSRNAQLRDNILRLMGDKTFYDCMRSNQLAMRRGGAAELAGHIMSQPYAEYKEDSIVRAGIVKEVFAAMREADARGGYGRIIADCCAENKTD